MKIRDLMTPDPIACPSTTTLADAARVMRDRAIGDVLVEDDDGRLCGIATDRDLVVRGLAAGSIDSLTLGDVCTRDPRTVQADDDLSEIVALMGDLTLRRVPVMDGDKTVGIVSLGDLAEKLDADSALGKISAAPPDA